MGKHHVVTSGYQLELDHAQFDFVKDLFSGLKEDGDNLTVQDQFDRFVLCCMNAGVRPMDILKRIPTFQQGVSSWE